MSSGNGTIVPGGTADEGDYTASASTGSETVRVLDSIGIAGYANIMVIDPAFNPLVILPGALTLSTNDSFSFTASGGVPGYTFDIVSGGGSIDAGTGAFIAPGSSGSVTVRVTDADTTTRNATVSVIEGLVISPQSASVPETNQMTFSATGGTAPYTFSMDSGLGIISSGGVYTAPLGIGTGYVKVTDFSGSSRIAQVTVTGEQALIISPSSLVMLTGSNFVFSATGGTPPYVFSKQSGNGTVTSGGSYSSLGIPGIGVVRVTDENGTGDSSDAVITIVSIGPLAISPAVVTVEQGKSFTFAAIGGTPQYVYSIQAGSGFINSSTGEYMAPVTLGTDIVRVTDSFLNSADATVNISPSAPNNLVVDGTFLGPQDIRLTWTDNAVGETGYLVERKISGGVYSEIADLPPNTTFFDDGGLTPNIPYAYRVRAYSDPNPDYSGYSNDDFDIPNS